MKYIISLRSGLDKLLERNKTYLLGENIRDPFGGAFKVTRGLTKKHKDKIIDMPVAEAGFTGFAIGMALAGAEPIVEIMFSDFSTLIADQIINGISKMGDMWKMDPPKLLIRMPVGGRRGYGPTHSQNMETLFMGWPNIRIYSCGCLHNPEKVLHDVFELSGVKFFLEPKLEYDQELVEPDEVINGFSIKRYVSSGEHPIILTHGPSVRLALAVQAALEVDVVVPTCIYPFDEDTFIRIVNEMCPTHPGIVILEESHEKYGWGSQITCDLPRDFYCYQLGAADRSIPNSMYLERKMLPTLMKIKYAVEMVSP